MTRQGQHCLLVFWGAVLLLVTALPLDVRACRVSEPPRDNSEVLWVHLEGFCLSKDRRRLAVKGADVLQALQEGKSLDVQGAFIDGDIMLDRLPLQAIEEISTIPPHIQERLLQRGLTAVRVIPGSVHVRDSQFEKVLATNLVNDILIILGVVEISGTTFLQSVDFSQIIFVKEMVFTNVEVGFEGFFIGTDFEQSADFSQTVFGTHSRFHKAVFRAPVVFSGVQFKGVAEFLEVQFHQAANFSEVYFLSGTGFSGSVFHGPVDFSGVETHQEIYFRFSEFKQHVSFQQAQFQAVVDFSNSRFGSLEDSPDFSDTEFAIQPNFSDSNISVRVPVIGRRVNQQAQWMIFGGLVILAGIYLWISRKKSPSNSA